MVFRLVVDAVRRKWLIGAFAVFWLYTIFKFLGRLWPSSEGMAWTMAGAWFLTIGAGELFRSRELYQLPVSRRAWWLARWWLSVTAPVAMSQLAAAFAYWSAHSEWPGVEQSVLWMTFGILYCGCAMSLQTTSLGRSGDAPATVGSVGLFGPVMLGLFAGPFVLAPFLPHSFAEIQATSAIVMLALAVFAGRGYLYRPTIEARPQQRVIRRDPSSPGPAPAIVMTPAGLVDRLTGLKLVLWNECRTQLIIFSTVIAMGVAYWAVASRVRPMPALGEFLRLAAVLPFSSPSARITEPIVFGALVAVATLAEPGMLADIRSLRTRPISSARLGCIPAGLGLVSATMLWIVLLALHGLVVGTLPASLRPDLFVAFAALTALAQAIRFITPGHTVGKSMLGFAPVAITWLALGYFSDSWRADVVQRAMLMGGLLTLAASWAAMRQAVMRSRTLYQPRPAAGRVTG